MAIIAVGAAVVGVGATVGGNVIKGNALKKSADAQKQAYNSLQPINADEISRISTQAELDRFKSSIQSQQKLDPTFASLRSTGGNTILQSLAADQAGNTASDRALKESEATIGATKDKNSALIAQLLDKVKEDLDAGATLPPEFQSELIRSGLEGAGTNGVNLDGRAAGGTGIRRLLGSEGLALKERREASARANLGAADGLQGSRLEALRGLSALDQAITSAKVGRAASGIALGDAMMPKLGLSGADAAQIALRNNQLANAKILGAASVDSNLAIQKGELGANNVGSIAAGLNQAGGVFASQYDTKKGTNTNDWFKKTV